MCVILARGLVADVHLHSAAGGETFRGSTDMRPVAPGLDARHEAFPDAAGAYGQCVHGDTEPSGQRATALDLAPPRVRVILDDQLALRGLELLHAALETVG